MPDAILSLPIIHGPAIWICLGLAAAALVTLLVRRPTAMRVLGSAVAMLGAVLVAILAIIGTTVARTFGEPLPVNVALMAAATFGAVGLAVANLWDSPGWRKAVAAVSIPVLLVAGTLAINAAYGVNPTVGSLFGIVVERPIPIPTGSGASTPVGDRPLYETWQPAADMPDKGRTGTQEISATVSGFQARTPGIYLPPAALASNAPPLPFVLMMMGQPGTPDPTAIAEVLDGFAAEHDGLAPIVIVADQLGDPANDPNPLCADSDALGHVETYLTVDVVDWARANLNILDDPKYWTVVGYSNGGACAFKFGADHPDIWGNVISVSGEPFPGSEAPDRAACDVFGCDSAAFEANKPTSILASGRYAYPDTVAIFTAGQQDDEYVQDMQESAQAAQAAGWDVTTDVIEGADHGSGAVSGGLTAGFEVLYPRFGLSAPR